MKLVRFGEKNGERPGVWLDDKPGRGQADILDVRAMAFDIEDYNAHFFATHGLERLRALLGETSLKLIPAAGMRLGPPIARPGKIVCLGKNYAAHAAEFDSQVPDSPIFFSKATTALNGPRTSSSPEAYLPSSLMSTMSHTGFVLLSSATEAIGLLNSPSVSFSTSIVLCCLPSHVNSPVRADWRYMKSASTFESL